MKKSVILAFVIFCALFSFVFTLGVLGEDTQTWGEYVKNNPMPEDMPTSGKYEKGAYAFEWSFDKTTGTLIVKPVSDKGDVNKFDVSEWSAGKLIGDFLGTYRKYVRAINLPEVDIGGKKVAINQIWVQNNDAYNMNDMIYLESFTFAANKIKFQDISLKNCPNLRTFGKEGTADGTLDFSCVDFISAPKDFLLGSAMTGVKKAVFLTSANVKAILSGALNGDVDVTIGADTKKASEVANELGFSLGVKKDASTGTGDMNVPDETGKSDETAKTDDSGTSEPTTPTRPTDVGEAPIAHNLSESKEPTTWSEYVEKYPMPAEMQTSGEYAKGLYAFKWSFDKTNGTLTVVPTAEKDGGINKFDVSQWGAGLVIGDFLKEYREYVREISFPEVEVAGKMISINQIWDQNSSTYNFDNMIYLEKITFAAVSINFQNITFKNCPNLRTLGKEGTEDGTIDFTNINFIEAPKDFLAGSSVTGVKTVFLNDEYKNISAKALLSGALNCDALIVSGGKGIYAEEFAQANDYSIYDFDSESPFDAAAAKKNAPKSPEEGGEFKPVGATAFGHMTGKYGSSEIINTFWAWYESTKTLEFVSGTTNYNETGKSSNCDKESGTNWNVYRALVEHVVIGNNISKITYETFQNMTALKDVKLGENITQIDQNAFSGCTSLETIWRADGERVEGRADLSKIGKIVGAFEKTAIKEVLISPSIKDFTFELPLSVRTIISSNITDELISYAKTYQYDLRDATDDTKIWENYVEIDTSLPYCGGRAVFDFDEATGTLTIYGSGTIDEIINYYGGGSKSQPWFPIKKQIKHIVIPDGITGIGKYAFCECSNLETVELPAGQIELGNAAFEKCTNLKSVYRRGTDAIEGTADLRGVVTLNPFVFASDFLIANVIISSETTKIGISTFDENINLKGVYGTPGSDAETFASNNGLTFADISSGMPSPVKCEIPESTDEDTKHVTTPDTETIAKTPETSGEAKSDGYVFVDDTGENDTENKGENNIIVITVIAVVVAVVIIGGIVAFIVKKKKSTK